MEPIPSSLEQTRKQSAGDLGEETFSVLLRWKARESDSLRLPQELA
jgi:hypothetical protein